MNFTWISYEMKSNLFIWNSWEVYMKIMWSSNELVMNFIWNVIKSIRMNLHRRTNEVNMLYPCNANEAGMRHINSSQQIHMKYHIILNDLNFMWALCELHKDYMTSAQEVPMYYTWIWFLASLLCTSYEWASRSIVVYPSRHTTIICEWCIIMEPLWTLSCGNAASEFARRICWKHDSESPITNGIT